MKMELLLETPGRGRSRFSKALPTAPEVLPHHLPSTKSVQSSSSSHSSLSLSTSLNSPLPPIPKQTTSTMAIPRRPVGGPPIHTKLPSVDSVSSVYSDSPGFSRSLSDSSRRTKDSLSCVDDSEPATPPLPPKDTQRQQASRSPKHVLATPTTSFQQSPPRPELWRRRSVKSDREISLPELKLEKSNGSTASPPQKVPAEASRFEAPSQLPRSRTGRKPVPSRPAPPQPEHMGSKLSKLRAREKRFSDDSSQDDHSIPSQPPTINRLPTPEYLQTDKQQPSTPNVVSPVSPETPPADNLPSIPEKSNARLNLPAISLIDTNDLENAISTSSHSRESSSTLTVTSEPPLMQSPQPHKSFAAKILTPQPSPSPSTITSPLELPSPLRKSGPISPFPRNTMIFPEGTAVFPAPPLEIVHFDCYQSHRFMRSSRNAIGPVACMMCQRQEPGPRWRCTWCCMGACGSCMEVLVSVPDRDLKTSLQMIGVPIAQEAQ